MGWVVILFRFFPVWHVKKQWYLSVFWFACLLSCELVYLFLCLRSFLSSSPIVAHSYPLWPSSSTEETRSPQGTWFHLTSTQSNNLAILLGGTRRWVDRWTDEKMEALHPWQKLLTLFTHPRGHTIIHPMTLTEGPLLYTKHVLWMKRWKNEGTRMYSSKLRCNCRSLSTSIPTCLFFMGIDLQLYYH